MQLAFKTGLTYAGNAQNMKPVQNCTGSIFCAFHAFVLSDGTKYAII